MPKKSLCSRLLAALGTVGVLAAGLVTFVSGTLTARAADGDVTSIAGGQPPYAGGNPIGPIAGAQVWFSVYAETIAEHGGSLYIRDIEGIQEVDATTGVTQRLVGLSYGSTSTSDLPADGVPATDVDIGWGRSMAVGPTGAVFFRARDNRIYRLDRASGLLHIVAGNGSVVPSGDGGPAIAAGLGLFDQSAKNALFVDDSNSIWFLDGSADVFPNSVRRIDGATGVISTVYEFLQYPPTQSRLLGFTPDGAAYVLGETYEIVEPFGVSSSQTVRIDAQGHAQGVSNRHTTCDDGVDAATIRDSHQWVDRGVFSTTISSEDHGVVLCTVDLVTGAFTERPLAGPITDFFGDLGSRRILADSVTTRADGTSFFVSSEGDGTYKLYRWDGGAPPEPPNFVVRNGSQLMYEGQPFRFTGMNLYDANNTAGCGGQYGSGDALGRAIDLMGGAQVMRSWFFQPLATSGGTRDWTSFDHTLAVAASKGVKVIATLGNQWADCDGLNGSAGTYKNDAWYGGGYKVDISPGMIETYRAWVADVVARYRDNPTILAWELVNEPEAKVVKDGACPSNAGGLLYDFAADVAGLIKATDPNHLVSLGTIGGGQCGSDNADYSALHGIASIDLCSIHDYNAPDDAMAGDAYNGIAKRFEQCRALGKPLFIGEAGLQLPETAGSTAVRAQKLTAKMQAEFRAGAAGYVLWAWVNPPRIATSLSDDIHDIGPGDPVLANLAVAPTAWPYDGGDTDNDGISNAVDAANGPATSAWDDHAGSSGSITDANGLSAVILDAPTPAGVTIYVPRVGAPERFMTLSVCGYTILVLSGTAADLTCGSVTAKVATGRINVKLSSDTFVTIAGGSTATVASSPNGAFTVSNVVGLAANVSVEGSVTSVAAGSAPKSFAAWQFIGFMNPVKNTGRNSGVAGRTVPLVFRLLDPRGRPVHALQAATISVVSVACPGGRVVPDGSPVIVTLHQGLHSLGRGMYLINWVTPKTYKGSCKEMRLDLGEGITRNASFDFK